MATSAAGFGCNTYSYIRTCRADECVSRLMARGFREFELMIHPGHLWPPSPEAEGLAALRRVLDDGHAIVTTINMPNIDINVAAAAEGMRRYSLELVSGAVRLAGALGAPGVVIGPGKANPLFPADAAELTPHFYAALDVLAPLAKSCGTALWVENMPFAFLPGIDALCDALDRYGDDTIGIVYDVANAHFIKEDIRYGLQRSKPRLKLVHLSDTGLGSYRHDPVGLGTVPFVTIPALLREAGYRNRPMLEIISRNPDADIAASVDKLRTLGFDSIAV